MKKNYPKGKKHHNAKNYTVISPDEQRIHVQGTLEKFCRNNEICYSALCRTIKTGEPVTRGKTKDWLLIKD